MLDKLIGAVAIEDNGIYFTVSSFEPKVNSLSQRVRPVSFVPKPDGGFSKLFIGEKIKEFFEAQSGDFAAIGISVFGVIDTDSCILLSVPRRDWDKSDFRSETDSTVNLNFKHMFGNKRWREIHVGVVNDATASALGEASEHNEGRLGSKTVLAYVRIGSGINSGVLRNGRPLRNRLQPEIGHVRPRRHPKDWFVGCCDFHKDCFDGLASLRAVTARAGHSLDDLDKQTGHPVWDFEAYYLAQICGLLSMIVAPHCIVLGGSVMRDHLFECVRDYFGFLVGNYPRYKENKNLYTYIRSAKIKNCASLRGALWLAQIKGRGGNVESIF